MGPPSDPPNWLNLISGLAVVGGRNGSRDENASLWKFSNSDPWNWLVPERVIMLTWPPIEPPYSAGRTPLATCTSATASTLRISIWFWPP